MRYVRQPRRERSFAQAREQLVLRRALPCAPALEDREPDRGEKEEVDEARDRVLRAPAPRPMAQSAGAAVSPLRVPVQ